MSNQEETTTVLVADYNKEAGDYEIKTGRYRNYSFGLPVICDRAAMAFLGVTERPKQVTVTVSTKRFKGCRTATRSSYKPDHVELPKCHAKTLAAFTLDSSEYWKIAAEQYIRPAVVDALTELGVRLGKRFYWSIK